MTKVLTLLLLVGFYSVFSQDFHQRPPDTVEELMRKNNPNQYRAMRNKEKYLVVENLRRNHRKRFYLGDTFRFRTVDDLIFQDELSRLTDSTFTITYFDLTSNRIEMRTFRIDEITHVYKRPIRKGIRIPFSIAALSPMLYDWMWFRIPPWQNSSTLYGIAGITAANILISNSDRFFRRRKVSENYRIRVYQAY